MNWLWLSGVVLILDIASKQVASAYLTLGRSVDVLPVFKFTLLHNHGAAFSFLADQAGWQRWFFVILTSVVSLFLLVWLRNTKNQPWVSCAIALIFGGAIGNLVDRVLLGYVVDFLHFHWNEYHFPAFNIADSAISIGAAMLVIDAFRGGNNHANHQSPQ